MMCRLWYERLDEPRAVFHFEYRLKEATRIVDTQPRDASALRSALETLASLADDLAIAERRELDILERELNSRQQQGEVSEQFASSVRRALSGGSVLQARDLLQHADSDEESRQVTPYRSIIANLAPVERLVAWMKSGQESDRPWNFRTLWAPSQDDLIGMKLLDAIDLSLTGPPESTQVAFSRLINILERALGADNVTADGPSVALLPGRVLAGRLRGLRAQGLYAFEDSAYDEGVPIILPLRLEGTSVSRGVGGSLDTDTFGEEGLTSDAFEEGQLASDELSGNATVGQPQSVTPYYVVIGDTPVFGIDGRALRLDWRQLLSVVGDRNRALNLRRFIGRQISAEDAFPEATSRPSTLGLIVGRDEVPDEMFSEAREGLWVGPSGSGRTALLRRAEERARQNGYTISQITDLETLDQTFDFFTKSTTDDWLRDVRATRLFVTIDDIDKLEAARAGAGARATVLLQSIRDQNDERVRAAGTADPAFIAQGLATSWRWLPPLTFADSRYLLLQLLDLSGGVADDRAIDQVAWYAGGHVRILHFLLRGIRALGESAGDFWRIGVSQVEIFATRADTQRTARAMLLETLRLMPALTTAVFAVVWDTLITRGVTERQIEETTVLEELQTWSTRQVAPEAVRAALRALESAYVLEAQDGGWRLPDNGLGLVLADRDLKALADGYLEAFIAAAG
jgi:hypothetical protein